MVDIIAFFNSDTLKLILIATIYLLTILTIELMIVLLFHNIYFSLREKRKEKLTGYYTPLIINYLVKNKKSKDFPVELKPFSGLTTIGELISLFNRSKNNNCRYCPRDQFFVIADICIYLILSIKNINLEKVHLMLNETGVAKYLVKLAASDRWNVRYQAFEKLGNLRIRELKPFYFSALKKEKRLKVRLRILVALSHLTDSEIFSTLIIEFNKKFLMISDNLLKKIFYDAVRSFCIQEPELFREAFRNTIFDNKVNPKLKKALISACREQYTPEIADLVAGLASYHLIGDNLKAACIRFLGRKEPEKYQEIITESFDDNSFIVRLAAAKADISLDNRLFRKKMTAALHDFNYFVRLATARNLSRSQEGRNILLEQLNSEDKFLRETVGYFIEVKKKTYELY